jgi:hypothetical protein
VHVILNLKTKFKGLVTKTVEELVYEMQFASSESAFNSRIATLASLQNCVAAQADAAVDVSTAL